MGCGGGSAGIESSGSCCDHCPMGTTLHSASLGACHWAFRNRAIRAKRRACSVRLVAKAEIKYVSSKQAKSLIEEENYTVVDVRDETQYERAHIPGTGREIPCS